MSHRSRQSQLESLENRRLLAAPVLDAIGNQSVPSNKTIQIPLTASDSDGDALSYSVSSNSGSVIPTLRSTNNTYLKLTVKNFGDMIFQLFNDVAPEAVRNITGLINAGYYNGLTFHRIIDNFVIQGGDKAGTGSGPSPIHFNDEFNPNTIFSGDGQLAMANGGKDTNGTQFFITEGAQRALDFNHTIFGQLLRGKSVRDAISGVAADSNGKPNTPVIITSAQIIQDKTDQVLQVKVNGTATGTVTVTVNDGHGGTNQKTFTATGTADSTDDPPILTPPGNRLVAKNSSITINLSSTDLENSAVDFAAALQTAGQGTINADSSTSLLPGHQLIFTPKANFTGPVTIFIGVEQHGATGRGSTQNAFDIETITIGVGDKSVSGTAVNVNALAGANAPNMVVAKFTDSDPAGLVSDWAAIINWGDGQDAAEDGVIVKNSDGTFSVMGSHAYTTSAHFPITVEITGNKGAISRLTPTATAQNIATLSGGELTINGSSGSDTINVVKNSSDNKIHVTTNGAKDKTFSASLVHHVSLFAYAADDKVTIGSSGVPAAYVDAGEGNDNVSGGAGNDILIGGAGKNTLAGNGGDDRLSASGSRDNLAGGDGSDRLYGGGGDDVLDGGGGVDRLYGEDGNDMLVGGGSNDKLYAGNGNDKLFGGKGTDLLNGGVGDDTVFGQDAGESPTEVEHIV